MIYKYTGKKLRREPKEARYCMRLLNGMYVDSSNPKSSHGRYSNDSLHKLLDNAEFVEDKIYGTVYLERPFDIPPD